MIDGDRLVARAVRETELDDFGDGRWREGFHRLVASLNAEALLTPLGEKVTMFRLRTLLQNRLRIEGCYRQNPSIDGERIEAPIFIIGLPRTGTTALSNLLAMDPQIRSLRLWESSDPVPPPDAATRGTDPRIARTQAGLDAMDRLYPRMKALYPQTAVGPTECQDLLVMSFRTIHFDGQTRVPSYVAWVIAAEMAPAYEYHRRVLKLLQWRCPPTLWHLKTPAHMLSLDSLDAAYPDARFIWTHRDLAEVVASVCSLITYLRAMGSEQADSAELGRQQLDLWTEAIRRALTFRDRAGEDRFVDVSSVSLAANAADAVRRVYERLGLTLGVEAERAMQHRAETHPKGGHGGHDYRLSDYGLTAGDVRGRFASYLDRFGNRIIARAT